MNTIKKISRRSILLSVLLCAMRFCSMAQDSSSPCQVLVFNLGEKYVGECKNGYADGAGEARGKHHYIGNFKNGMPNDLELISTTTVLIMPDIFWRHNEKEKENCITST